VEQESGRRKLATKRRKPSIPFTHTFPYVYERKMNLFNLRLYDSF
jgi:hypothetical protein